jgi:hypothetical protein
VKRFRQGFLGTATDITHDELSFTLVTFEARERRKKKKSNKERNRKRVNAILFFIENVK